jgi:hypothetical protein
MKRGTDTFISSLSQAVRENPIAATLIGGGALWFMLGNRPISRAASAAQPLAESGMRGISNAADAVTSAGGRAADAVMETARAAGEAASSGAAAASDRMAETFDRTADSVNRATGKLGRAGETLRPPPNPLPHLQRGYANAQSTLADLFERQPLVLGAIGLAIGAGAASALARTSFEDEWAGSMSDEVKDAVADRAEHVAEAAQQAASEVGGEFRAAAGEAADKLRKAGAETVQTAREEAQI